MRIRKLSVAGMFVGAWLLLGAAPAFAELPAISCTKGNNPFNWCVSYLNFRAQAGVGNPTNLTLTVNAPRNDYFRVELVYYPGLPAQRGEVVFAGDEFIFVMTRGMVKRSPEFATLLPGTYCSRMYIPALGYYSDQHCVTTNGQVVPGNIGSVPPRPGPY